MICPAPLMPDATLAGSGRIVPSWTNAVWPPGLFWYMTVPTTVPASFNPPGATVALIAPVGRPMSFMTPPERRKACTVPSPKS